MDDYDGDAVAAPGWGFGEGQEALMYRQMAVYKAPRVIHFLDALPKTATGKILRRVLREKAATLGAPKL